MSLQWLHTGVKYHLKLNMLIGASSNRTTPSLIILSFIFTLPEKFMQKLLRVLYLNYDLNSQIPCNNLINLFMLCTWALKISGGDTLLLAVIDKLLYWIYFLKESLAFIFCKAGKGKMCERRQKMIRLVSKISTLVHFELWRLVKSRFQIKFLFTILEVTCQSHWYSH